MKKDANVQSHNLFFGRELTNSNQLSVTTSLNGEDMSGWDGFENDLLHIRTNKATVDRSTIETPERVR